MSAAPFHVCDELLSGTYRRADGPAAVMLIMRCGCGHEIRMAMTAAQARVQAGALAELANAVDGGRGVQ